MHAPKPIRVRAFAFFMFAVVAYVGIVMAWPSPAALATAEPGTISSDGWTAMAPRDEIRPAFAFDPTGGLDGKGALRITADKREGLAGYWAKPFPVKGGKHYSFIANYQAKGVVTPRRSVLAELHWRDAKGRAVPLDSPTVTDYLRGATAMAETEFPATRKTDSSGWTEVSDIYQAPSKATQAIVELHLRWSAQSEVHWSGVALTEISPPEPRNVRLATGHFRPNGGETPVDNSTCSNPLSTTPRSRRSALPYVITRKPQKMSACARPRTRYGRLSSLRCPR